MKAREMERICCVLENGLEESVFLEISSCSTLKEWIFGPLGGSLQIYGIMWGVISSWTTQQTVNLLRFTPDSEDRFKKVFSLVKV